MADLNTFADRTIDRARERFTDGKRGSGDDPIATHAKVAQDVMLGHLEALISRAENKAYDANAGLQGELDGKSLIDPFISYDENVAQIQDRYGVNFETYTRRERDAAVADAEEKAQRHAREALVEEFDAIEAGAATELVADIEAEFGADWVAEALAEERARRAEPAKAGAPEPAEPQSAPEEPGLERPARPTADPESDSTAAPSTVPAGAGSPSLLGGLRQIAAAVAILVGSFLAALKSGASLTLSAVSEVCGESRESAGNELATVAAATREVADDRQTTHV